METTPRGPEKSQSRRPTDWRSSIGGAIWRGGGKTICAGGGVAISSGWLQKKVSGKSTVTPKRFIRWKVFKMAEKERGRP